jgi:hypothetical protein
MRDSEKVQHPPCPLATARAVLKSQHLKVNDHEGPRKYNNTEVKYRATFFTAATQHLTPAVVMYEYLMKK